MSVYKRAEGRWQVLVDFERRPDGSRKRRSLGTFRTRKEAEAAERQAIDKRDRGIDVPLDRLTVGDLFERFFAASKPSLAAKTFERYSEIARLHIVPHIGTTPVSKLKPSALLALHATLRATRHRGKLLSECTVGKAHKLVHRVLAWAHASEQIERNVASKVTAPKGGAVVPKALAPEDVRRVLAAAPPSWKPFIALAFLTGARRGELLALRWGDVDFAKALLTIARSLSQTSAGVAIKSTKADRVRVVSLSTQALDALHAIRAGSAQGRLAAGPSDDDLIFSDEHGKPHAPDTVSNVYTAIAERAGVSVTNLHAARHTAATRMLAAGTDVRSVAGILGHADASITLRVYAHFVPQRAATALDALGDDLLGSAKAPPTEPVFPSEGNVLATLRQKAAR